jgi:hypothetical protein
MIFSQFVLCLLCYDFQSNLYYICFLCYDFQSVCIIYVFYVMIFSQFVLYMFFLLCFSVSLYYIFFLCYVFQLVCILFVISPLKIETEL